VYRVVPSSYCWAVRELLSADAIAGRVQELGATITQDYAGSPGLVLVGVLRGSLCFMSDLMRATAIPTRVELVDVRSYRGTQGGKPRLRLDLRGDLAGLDVLVVEDIVERGTTLSAVLAALRVHQPRTLAVAALLRKPAPAEPGRPEPRYVGFEISDEFVVGYGLDYDERFRHLPFIGVPDADDLAGDGQATGSK
jgi:hypoxanthine phosphoribosyltransferase